MAYTTTPLTGHKISLTYEPLIICPTASSGILYNGDGNQIYTNSDSIGTIKMFYPVGGSLASYFDTAGGLGVPGTPWEGWAICDGQNGSPNLKGRFIVGFDGGDADYNTIGNSNSSTKTTTLITDNLPSHRHKYFDGYMQARDGSGPYFSQVLEAEGNSQGVQQSGAIGGGMDIVEGSGSSREAAYSIRNTGDGTDNLAFQGGVNSLPFDKRPPYYTLLYVIKIS